MVIVTLTQKINALFTEHAIDSEHRIFSDIETAEKWLTENNFKTVHGLRNPEKVFWVHKNNNSEKYVDVTFENAEDQERESKFKNFDPGMDSWQKAAYEEGRREGFAKSIAKEDIPMEQKIKMFKEYFDTSWQDAEQWILQESIDSDSNSPMMLAKKARKELMQNKSTSVRCPLCGAVPEITTTPGGERTNLSCPCGYIHNGEINF